jgi:hypothetical protein
MRRIKETIMTFTVPTWILAIVPMLSIIVLSAIYYIRFQIRNKHNRTKE